MRNPRSPKKRILYTVCPRTPRWQLVLLIPTDSYRASAIGQPAPEAQLSATGKYFWIYIRTLLHNGSRLVLPSNRMKDIITKHYAVGMSGSKIDDQLKVSKSGVNDFLWIFGRCEYHGFPLPEGITNYGINKKSMARLHMPGSEIPVMSSRTMRISISNSQTKEIWDWYTFGTTMSGNAATKIRNH